MKVPNTITLIVARNYGHPLSLSLPARRAYLLAALLVALLVGMAALSALFLLRYPEAHRLREQNRQLLEEREALRDQILSANQEALRDKSEAFRTAAMKTEAEPREPADRVTPEPGDASYIPPIAVSEVTVKVNGRTVEVVFRLVKQTESVENRGGWLFAIFENRHVDPPRFAASPDVKTNADGFPDFYKAGLRFPRIREAITYRRRVRRPSLDSAFTHVTVYLFSLRGGLIIKDRFALDPELFNAGQKPVTRVVKQPQA